MPIKLKAALCGAAFGVRIRNKRYAGGRDRRVQLTNRRSIHDRPAVLVNRACVGHWQGDTVIVAAHKHANVSVVESKSGFAVLSKVEKKTSMAVSKAIIARIKT